MKFSLYKLQAWKFHTALKITVIPSNYTKQKELVIMSQCDHDDGL